MVWAQGLSQAGHDLRYLALASCDAPFLPQDLVTRLAAALVAQPEAKIAMAVSKDRRHPVFSLWSLELLAPLSAALRSGTRKVEAFTEPQGVALVPWSPEAGAGGAQVDPFFNINRPDDLAEAERLLSA